MMPDPPEGYTWCPRCPSPVNSGYPKNAAEHWDNPDHCGHAIGACMLCACARIVEVEVAALYRMAEVGPLMPVLRDAFTVSKLPRYRHYLAAFLWGARRGDNIRPGHGWTWSWT